jgi:hypothetical protein
VDSPVRPVYDDGPGIIDIDNFIVGASFGPMTITPVIEEDISDRTYSACIYDSVGEVLAEFDITPGPLTGVLSLLMTATESAKVEGAGIYDWAITYTETGDVKRAAWSGKVTAKVVPGILPGPQGP